jgi:hypothetical protein
MSLQCPICGQSDLARLPEAFVAATKQNGEDTSGDLLAYRCLEDGHVFVFRAG